MEKKTKIIIISAAAAAVLILSGVLAFFWMGLRLDSSCLTTVVFLTDIPLGNAASMQSNPKHIARYWE